MRDQLDTVGRMREAERQAAELQAQLSIARSSEGDLPPDPGTSDGAASDEGEGAQAARSLRSRLAESASRKKGRGDRDTGFGG